MGTVCHACGYERKPTDQAPDWECPACGKAYIKTSPDQEDSLPSAASDFSSTSSKQMDAGFTYRQDPGSSAFFNTGKPGTRYGLVLGIVLAVVLIWGIPILSNPSSASAVLFHGEFGFVCVALVAIGGIIFVTRRLGANIDPANPSTRFAFLVKFFALFCSVFFVLSIFWLRGKEHTEIKIQTNGQRVMADVVRIYTGSCGKRSCSIDVEYAFSPVPGTGDGSQLVHGYASLGSSNHPNDPDLIYARTYQRVPVAYEVGHPEVSALNFNDYIFSVDHSQHYHQTVGSMVKVFFGIFLVGLVVAWLSARSNPRGQ